MNPDLRCRSCGSPSLHSFLDLGTTPLSDGLRRADQLDTPDPSYPLEVAFCSDCTMVQITETLPEDVLFPDDYPYFSSFSDALLAHSRAHAEGLIRDRDLGPDSLVVELASNDGYLLRNFVEHGIPVMGIDPAPNQVAAANDAGVRSRCAFFGLEMARELRDELGPADVIIANNVMAHVPDLNGFVAGIAHWLAPGGVVTVENPWVRDLIDHVEFDTIYHEHLCYHSCTGISALVQRHGLALNHVEHFPDLHGGTLRWHLGHDEAQTPEAKQFLELERELGVDQLGYYESFRHRVEHVRDGLLDLLRDLKADGATIAGYGAAAKGSTLLNYVGIGTDLVDFVVDRNVHKQGLYMPGTHQPILDTSALVERRPDYVLLLAWNFAEEIVGQQQDYLAAGGRFIRPVPEPEIMST